MPDPSYRHQLTAEHARQAMPGLAPESGEEAHHWSPQTDATAEYDRQLDREVREADTPWARFDRAVSAAEAASARERREATRVRLAERESGQRSAAQTQLAREEAQQHVRQAMAERQAATEDACRAYARMQEETAGALSYKAEPLPRVLDSRTGGPSMAPVAATLRNGTPHSDPGLAQRGWQAQGGVYQRQPQAQLEAG